MLEVLTILLVFLSVFLIVLGLNARPMDPVVARLRAVQAGVRPRNPALSQPLIRRSIMPVAGGVVKLILKLTPPEWIKDVEKKLVWAGGGITLPGYVLIAVASAIAFPVAFVIFANTLFGTFTTVLAGIAGLAIGLFLPRFWLGARIAERNYRTRKALPDALDLMTTSVEAGLSLDAALIRVAEFQRGPFQEELTVALQDMTLGKSRRDALEEITQRLNVSEVITFIQSVNQAEVTGAPIGQVLRVQAEQVRVKRRQAAEAQAQRAPLLMIFPLAFFIFPSLFIVLLGPAALTIIDLLSNGNVFR